MFQQKDSFLTRSDFVIFTTTSNDETLKIHRAEHANLIITPLEMPGMSSEHLFLSIRKDATLRNVSVLMVCPSNQAAIEQSLRCGANEVLMRPVNPALILAKAQKLLNISPRDTSRMVVSVDGKVTVHGNPRESSFVCRLLDISASGMLVETKRTLTVGDVISCSFVLPNSRRLELTGAIVRFLRQKPDAAEYHYGIKFSNLSDNTRQALETLVIGMSNDSRSETS